MDLERSGTEGQSGQKLADNGRPDRQLGPWEEIALGARLELEKWAESRRDRRRERPRGSRRLRGSES